STAASTHKAGGKTMISPSAGGFRKFLKNSRLSSGVLYIFQLAAKILCFMIIARVYIEELLSPEADRPEDIQGWRHHRSKYESFYRHSLKLRRQPRCLHHPRFSWLQLQPES